MRIQKNRIYAVVTGDVIASRTLPKAKRQALHKAMREVSRAVRTAFTSAVPADVDIFRGDGWQMLLTEPALALRAALFYRAGLVARMESHRFDVRAAIGVGHVQFVPGTSVSEGDGEAFQASGKLLEAMARPTALRFGYPAVGPEQEESIDVVVQLVDRLAARWSDRQALAMTGALRGWKQAKIAKTCWKEPISQQAVAQHLDRASWSGIETALEYFERQVGQWSAVPRVSG